MAKELTKAEVRRNPLAEWVTAALQAVRERARATSQQTTCINNLRQIRSAISQWALENKASASSPVQFSDIQPYLRGSTVCPTGGTSFSDSYTITDVQTAPTCQKAPTGPEAHTEPPEVTQ